MMKKKLYVCISLDVEEEGLFSGEYASRNVGLENIALLKNLAPFYTDFGLPLTLFCAWPVFCDLKSQDILKWMQVNCKVEIGGHLHFWSTPPLDQEIAGTPHADQIAPELLEQKLITLLSAGKKFLGNSITSFRMGRWDLRRPFLRTLANHGIKVDSSICPLRAFKNGPNHFFAPASPYWVEFAYGEKILEAPVTQIPLFPVLPKLWGAFCSPWPTLLDKFHFFGALSANPVWHDMRVMKLAAIMTAAKDIPILNFFWHSSELMAGASPNVPTQKKADALLGKIFDYCLWLTRKFDIQGLTMTEMTRLSLATKFPLASGKQDW